jgi:hypothetical protein
MRRQPKHEPDPPSVVRYVDANIGDDNNQGTREAPWRTLRRVVHYFECEHERDSVWLRFVRGGQFDMWEGS